MKQIGVALILIVIFPANGFTQSDKENLEKYWHYRDRLRKSFIKIGIIDGESVPMDIRNHDNPCVPEGSTGFEGQRAEINWGDATIRLGYYVGVLASEYRLLKDNGREVNIAFELPEFFYILHCSNQSVVPAR